MNPYESPREIEQEPQAEIKIGLVEVGGVLTILGFIAAVMFLVGSIWLKDGVLGIFSLLSLLAACTGYAVMLIGGEA